MEQKTRTVKMFKRGRRSHCCYTERARCSLELPVPKIQFCKAPPVSLPHFLAPSATSRRQSSAGPWGAHPRKAAARLVTPLCLHQAGSCPPPSRGTAFLRVRDPPYTGLLGEFALRERIRTDQKGGGGGAGMEQPDPSTGPRPEATRGVGPQATSARPGGEGRRAMPAGTASPAPLPSHRPPPRLTVGPRGEGRVAGPTRRREPYLPCPPWRGGGSGAVAGGEVRRGGLGWARRAAGSSAPCSDPSGRGLYCFLPPPPAAPAPRTPSRANAGQSPPAAGPRQPIGERQGEGTGGRRARSAVTWEGGGCW